MLDALRTAGNPGRGAHEPTLHASRLVYAARCAISRLLNAPDPSCIAFAANATQALNTALGGLFSPGDHIITTVCEHNSVLRALYRLRDQEGIQLSFAGVDEKGRLQYDGWQELIQPNTKAVVVTGASNVTGNGTDLARISEFAHRNGLLLIVDAAQTAGAQPVDVQALDIDVLCFTGHKGLMGPQGTGGLAVAEGIDVAPWAMGGTGVHSFDALQPLEWPTRLEAGTLNGHGIAGLSAGLDFIEAQGGVEAIAAHERALADRFLAGVREIPGIKLYGAFDQPTRSAIVSLNVVDIDSAEISDALMQGWGIATRPGAHCAPLMHRALGTERQGVVRFSFGYFNTDEEVDTAIGALRDLAC